MKAKIAWNCKHYQLKSKKTCSSNQQASSIIIKIYLRHKIRRLKHKAWKCSIISQSHNIKFWRKILGSSWLIKQLGNEHRFEYCYSLIYRLDRISKVKTWIWLVLRISSSKVSFKFSKKAIWKWSTWDSIWKWKVEIGLSNVWTSSASCGVHNWQ